MKHNAEPNDLSKLWSTILEDIELQMTRATFETWMKTTQLVELDATSGQFVIAVPSTYALDWLENRLSRAIKETVERHFDIDGEVTLKFVVQNDDDGADTDIHQDGQSSGDREYAGSVELVSFDPTQKGWLQTSSYAIRFWLPLIGRGPFLLWQTLRSFAREGNEGWPSIRTLAAITCGSEYTQNITGRNDGRQRGWLEVLENERIVWYRIEKKKYYFRVLDNLPLLTPSQVEQLPKRLQRMHKEFLQKCQLDYQEWEQLTLPTLAKIQD